MQGAADEAQAQLILSPPHPTPLIPSHHLPSLQARMKGELAAYQQKMEEELRMRVRCYATESAPRHCTTPLHLCASASQEQALKQLEDSRQELESERQLVLEQRRQQKERADEEQARARQIQIENMELHQEVDALHKEKVALLTGVEVSENKLQASFCCQRSGRVMVSLRVCRL